MSTKSANSTAVNSFNANHSNYDVFRPSFTPVLVNPFLVHLGLATKTQMTPSLLTPQSIFLKLLLVLANSPETWLIMVGQIT